MAVASFQQEVTPESHFHHRQGSSAHHRTRSSCQTQRQEKKSRQQASMKRSRASLCVFATMVALLSSVSSTGGALAFSRVQMQQRQQQHQQQQFRQHVSTSQFQQRSSTELRMAIGNQNDDIARLKAKAMLELEKARAKLGETKEELTPQPPQNIEEEDVNSSSSSSAENNKNNAAPFFASVDESGVKRQQVIKSVNESTGLITTDGEKMAQLSEGEAWQSRPLLEVFDNELKSDKDDVYSLASQQLAERDVAASLFQLRKELQTEDFSKIFDKRNRFIGETE